MAKFQPAFEVTQVGSMQWNRTGPGAVIEASALDKEQAKSISKDVLDQIRNSIRKEIKKA